MTESSIEEETDNSFIITEDLEEESIINEQLEEKIDSDIEEVKINVPKEKYKTLLPVDSFIYSEPYNIRCLGELVLSRSSKFLNPFNNFLELKIDCDLHEILWAPEILPVYDDIGVERYKDLVKENNAETVQDIINQLGSTTMSLKYYGLKYKSYKILLEVLKYNKCIKHLDLTNNEFDSLDVANTLAEMIEANYTLESLNLTYCNIGPEKMEIICKTLAKNITLEELNLSHCNIGDDGLKLLAAELGQCEGIKKLDISYNKLTSNCAQELGDCIFDNNDLVELNLSGNTFGTESGFSLIANNLRDNFAQTITHLNLASCFLGPENEKSIKLLILKVSGLTHLDLSRNNIYGSIVEGIASVIRRSNLINLNLGYNPLKAEDLILLIGAIRAMRPIRRFKTLDLTDKYLPKECKEIVNAIKTRRTIIFRGYVCDFEIKGPDKKLMILNRLKSICDNAKGSKDKASKGSLGKSSLKAFGTFFYTIKNDYCKEADFPKFVEENFECEKLVQDKDFIKELMKIFTVDMSKINVGLMRDLYLQMYPDTPRPPPPPEEQPLENEKNEKRAKAKAKKKVK